MFGKPSVISDVLKLLPQQFVSRFPPSNRFLFYPLSFFRADSLEGNSEKTKIAWPEKRTTENPKTRKAERSQRRKIM